jgi:hypothetical protein
MDGELSRQDLDGNGPSQFEILGPVDFAHAPGTDQRKDLV